MNNTMAFRDLKAEEIECRVAMVRENGVSLLLYKDARCDMNILDETVGPFNWKRAHSRDNANCTVSIWDEAKAQWITKEDTGTESNTEAAKGLASDSFKRACFNWGIGRELYTAPFIWVPNDRCKIVNGKCYDKFYVNAITIKDKKIVGLSIINENTGKVVFTSGKAKTAPDYRAELRKFIEEHKLDKNAIVSACNLSNKSTNDEWGLALDYAKELVKNG